MIDDYGEYFSGRITQIEDRFKAGELTATELEDELAALDDEMTDALEDDDLSSEEYGSLVEEMERLRADETN